MTRNPKAKSLKLLVAALAAAAATSGCATVNAPNNLQLQDSKPAPPNTFRG
jgi:hypothetical protein